jgi:hypothetical protein
MAQHGNKWRHERTESFLVYMSVVVVGVVTIVFVGLISLDLPISDEPNLGIWKISVVENPNKESPVAAVAQFEVKKYVLPKFDVKLAAPASIMLNEIGFNVTACAKYVKCNNNSNHIKNNIVSVSFSRS